MCSSVWKWSRPSVNVEFGLAPKNDRYTMCATPASTAASIAAACTSRRSAVSLADTRNRVCTPFSADRIASPSAYPPPICAISTPCRYSGTREASRARTRCGTPALTSRRATRRPSPPVTPVTATRRSPDACVVVMAPILPPATEVPAPQARRERCAAAAATLGGCGGGHRWDTGAMSRRADAGVSPMRRFDPVRLGHAEADAWIAYYQRRWWTFLRAAVTMVRVGFGLPIATSVHGAWYVLRANQLWAPYPANDPDGATTYMR